MKNVKLDQIMQLHQSENFAYFDFVEFFVSSVIGKACFKQNCCDNLLSQYATISDEAFAILIFENNLDAWIDMGVRKDTSGTEVPRKYTNGGRSKGEMASSQHNKGWSEQGLKRFNELFDKVKENRATPEAVIFEERFRAYCEDEASSKKKRIKEFEQELFVIRHKLFSENENESTEKCGGVEKPKHKKQKKNISTAIVTTVVSMDNIEATTCTKCNDVGGNSSNNSTETDADDNDEDESEEEGEPPDSDGPVLVAF